MREKEGLVLLYDDKILRELSNHLSFEILFTSDPYQKIDAKKTFFVTKAILDKIIGIKNPFMMAALAPLPPLKNPSGSRILAIDRLQDPGNIGALLRAAEAFSFDFVYFLEGSCDPFQDKLNRSARGANFRLPIGSGPIDKLEALKIPFIAASMEGEEMAPSSPIPPPFVLFIGHEGEGVSTSIKKCSKLYRLPMKSTVESLNASHAGLIMMYLMRANGL